MTHTPIALPGDQIAQQIYAGSRTSVYQGLRECDRISVVLKNSTVNAPPSPNWFNSEIIITQFNFIKKLFIESSVVMIKILLTGQVDELAIDLTKKQADIYKCFSKPWSETDLLETIKSGLSQL